MEKSEPSQPKSAFDSLLKKYKITNQIGAGGSSKVLAAKHRQTGQKVAIKVIEIKQKSDSYFFRKILREIIISRKLTEQTENSFSCKLLDIIFPDGIALEEDQNQSNEKDEVTSLCEQIGTLIKFTHIFLVFERQEGDLKRMLYDSNAQLQEQHVIVIIYNILCAINFIHSTGVIHRDIKPENILINANSHIQICDFGLSRCMPKIESEQVLKGSKKHPFIVASNDDDR